MSVTEILPVSLHPLVENIPDSREEIVERVNSVLTDSERSLANDFTRPAEIQTLSDRVMGSSLHDLYILRRQAENRTSLAQWQHYDRFLTKLSHNTLNQNSVIYTTAQSRRDHGQDHKCREASGMLSEVVSDVNFNAFAIFTHIPESQIWNTCPNNWLKIIMPIPQACQRMGYQHVGNFRLGSLSLPMIDISRRRGYVAVNVSDTIVGYYSARHKKLILTLNPLMHAREDRVSMTTLLDRKDLLKQILNKIKDISGDEYVSQNPLREILTKASEARGLCELLIAQALSISSESNNRAVSAQQQVLTTVRNIDSHIAQLNALRERLVAYREEAAVQTIVADSDEECAINAVIETAAAIENILSMNEVADVAIASGGVRVNLSPVTFTNNQAARQSCDNIVVTFPSPIGTAPTFAGDHPIVEFNAMRLGSASIPFAQNVANGNLQAAITILIGAINSYRPEGVAAQSVERPEWGV